MWLIVAWFSPLIPLPMNLIALHTGGELVEVHLADIVEGVAQVVGEGGGIPQDVAELEGYLMTALGGELVVVVADDFLHLVGHFAGFAGEAEGGVDDGAGLGVDCGAQGTLLIFVDGH